MGIEIWTLGIAVVTALACSICGVLLLVNRDALISEGLSHAVLPGIILAYVVLRDRTSPWLILAAGLSGLVMVLLVQALRHTRLVKDDASLGIVFPALFSLGVILASQKLGGVHFHAHCIIDGNLALAVLDRLRIGGRDVGPEPFYLMAGVLVLLLVFVVLFFKELKLSIFDRGLASALGFRPALLALVWLSLVSMTTVGAFETAGSILVVALMITPPAIAYLLTDDLKQMMFVSAAAGALSAVVGFYLGLGLDIAPTGPMSVVAGLLFLVVLLIAPKRGLLARRRRRRSQQQSLREHVLLTQVQHLGAATLPELERAMPWEAGRLQRTLRRAVTRGWLHEQAGRYGLTPSGSEELERPLLEMGFPLPAVAEA